MPQEIQVWYILPALRREFAKCMVEEFGLTQKKAATLLGVTESAVSQYFKSKRAKQVDFDNSVLHKVKESCAKILEGNGNLSEEIYKLSISEDVKKSMCKIHKEDENVSDTCNMCFKYEEWQHG